jgi:hypothetical protein
MSRRGKWIMKTITSGRTVEKIKFKVGANAKIKRGRRKKGSTPIRKQESNFRSAVKRLARLLNCNFSHGDLWITLTYADKYLCESFEDAEHQLDLFQRRMRSKFKKLGMEFRYISVTSDIDGQTGELVRVHHHIVMPRVPFELVCECWKYGTVDYRLLKDQADYTPLAVYLLNQAKNQPDAKKYSPSRNLQKPIVNEEFVADGTREIRVPKNAVVMHRDEYDRAIGTQYVRYVLPKKGEENDANERKAATRIPRAKQHQATAGRETHSAAGSKKKTAKYPD